MQESSLQPNDSVSTVAEANAAKQPWEPPHLEVLPLSETRFTLGGGLDGTGAGVS